MPGPNRCRIRGDAFRSARPADWNREEISIGAGGFIFVGVRGEAKFLAVGRKCDGFGLAEIERRNVVIGTRREVAGRASIQRGNEKMAALAVRPRVPMAVEQLFIDVAFTLLSFFCASRWALQASSLQSGYTLEMNAIDFPSGDHNSLSAPVEREVSCAASPPSSGIE